MGSIPTRGGVTTTIAENTLSEHVLNQGIASLGPTALGSLLLKWQDLGAHERHRVLKLLQIGEGFRHLPLHCFGFFEETRMRVIVREEMRRRHGAHLDLLGQDLLGGPGNPPDVPGQADTALHHFDGERALTEESNGPRQFGQRHIAHLKRTQIHPFSLKVMRKLPVIFS